MKLKRSVAVLLAASLVMCASALAQPQPVMYKFVFKGTCYQRDGTGNIVGISITDQSFIQDRAQAGGVDPSTLAIVYHLNGDPKGDTVEVVNATNGIVQVLQFGFWFGSDPSLGRSALTNSTVTEIRRVDQLFTLSNSSFTSENSHGMGTVFITKRFLTDTNGAVHAVIEGPLQWIVNPQGTNSTKVCYGAFTASQPLF
jgi:hypothetical protein